MPSPEGSNYSTEVNSDTARSLGALSIEHWQRSDERMEGRLPAVPRPVRSHDSDSARVALARARLRGAPRPDVVVFEGPCPGCQRQAEWHEEREDTRLRITIACTC